MEDVTCGSCYGCENEGTPPHPCPYKVEIHDDYDTLCTCCEECEHECAWEVSDALSAQCYYIPASEFTESGMINPSATELEVAAMKAHFALPSAKDPEMWA